MGRCALRTFDRFCLLAIRVLLRMALALDGARLVLPRRVRRWRGSVRKL